MDELIEIYQYHIQRLNEQIQGWLKDQSDAVGTGTQNSFNILIRAAQKEILEKEKILNELLELVSQQKSPTYVPADDLINIFVISGSIARVKIALGTTFPLLNPLLHDQTPEDWQPFSDEQDKIIAFLHKIKEQGYNFKVFYLEGKIEGGLLATAIDPSKNNIAIVDLMSLDEINIRTAIYFDGRNNNTVITPICNLLQNDLKKFLQKRRDDVFSVMDSQYLSMTSFIFDISSKKNLEREIINHLKRYKPTPVFLSNRSNNLPIGFSPSL